MNKIFRKNSAKSDIPEICVYCENCVHIELTERFICKKGSTLRQVNDIDTCKKFKPDVLRLNPLPRKKYRPDADLKF